MEKKRKAKNNLRIRNPWVKVLFIGIILLLLIVILEFLNNNYLPKFSFNDINHNKDYVLLLIIVIIIIFLSFKLFNRVRGNGVDDVERGDVKKALKIIDALLGKLSKEEINKFSRTEDAKIYERVLKSYGV